MEIKLEIQIIPEPINLINKEIELLNIYDFDDLRKYFTINVEESSDIWEEENQKLIRFMKLVLKKK